MLAAVFVVFFVSAIDDVSWMHFHHFTTSFVYSSSLASIQGTLFFYNNFDSSSVFECICDTYNACVCASFIKIDSQSQLLFNNISSSWDKKKKMYVMAHRLLPIFHHRCELPNTFIILIHSVALFKVKSTE